MINNSYYNIKERIGFSKVPSLFHINHLYKLAVNWPLFTPSEGNLYSLYKIFFERRSPKLLFKTVLSIVIKNNELFSNDNSTLGNRVFDCFAPILDLDENIKYSIKFLNFKFNNYIDCFERYESTYYCLDYSLIRDLFDNSCSTKKIITFNYAWKDNLIYSSKNCYIRPKRIKLNILNSVKNEKKIIQTIENTKSNIRSIVIYDKAIIKELSVKDKYSSDLYYKKDYKSFILNKNLFNLILYNKKMTAKENFKFIKYNIKNFNIDIKNFLIKKYNI